MKNLKDKESTAPAAQTSRGTAAPNLAAKRQQPRPHQRPQPRRDSGSNLGRASGPNFAALAAATSAAPAAQTSPQ